LTPYASIGILNLDGNGNFTVTQYQYGSSGTQTLNGSGTYSEGTNCTLNLTFTVAPSGTSGALTPPAAFATLLSTPTQTGPNYTTGGTFTTSGLVTLQPTTGQVISGIIISQ
jgi:hypothetical protein